MIGDIGIKRLCVLNGEPLFGSELQYDNKYRLAEFWQRTWTSGNIIHENV